MWDGNTIAVWCKIANRNNADATHRLVTELRFGVKLLIGTTRAAAAETETTSEDPEMGSETSGIFNRSLQDVKQRAKRILSRMTAAFLILTVLQKPETITCLAIAAYEQ